MFKKMRHFSRRALKILTSFQHPLSTQKWSSDDKSLVTKMGKMALKLLEKNRSVFFEDDVKEFGLKLTEVTVFSGTCTELPAAAADGRRTFCFIHFSFQVKVRILAPERCFHFCLLKVGKFLYARMSLIFIITPCLVQSATHPHVK